MLLEQISSIRVINLRHRADRRIEMLSELRRMGLADDARLRFFDAIRPADPAAFSSRGARGVYLSQLAILEEAAARGHSVLILEDDADFIVPDINVPMPAAWHIFYGGYYALTPGSLENSDIVGAHCMAFHHSVVGRLATFLRDLLETSDHPTIDGAYVWFRRAHPDVITVFARPPIAEQRPSRTDIAELRWLDRLPVVREAVGAMRPLKRWVRRRLAGTAR